MKGDLQKGFIRQMWVATPGGDALERSTPDLIGEVLQKGWVRSTRNRRACMTRCMNVDEAKGVCKDRSRWRSVVSAYAPMGKRREFMYVCYCRKCR